MLFAVCMHRLQLLVDTVSNLSFTQVVAKLKKSLIPQTEKLNVAHKAKRDVACGKCLVVHGVVVQMNAHAINSQLLVFRSKWMIELNNTFFHWCEPTSSNAWGCCRNVMFSESD